MEIFILVIKVTTIRTILSLATSHHWPTRQIDILNAFLHRHFNEEVYMEQPEGFKDKDKPDYVEKLTIPFMDKNSLRMHGLVIYVPSWNQWVLQNLKLITLFLLNTLVLIKFLFLLMLMIS